MKEDIEQAWEEWIKFLGKDKEYHSLHSFKNWILIFPGIAPSREACFYQGWKRGREDLKRHSLKV